MRHALVIAGGSGKRLWPMSRAALPKQLIPFIEGRSLLQVALDRLEGLVPPARRYVCAAEAHRDIIMASLEGLEGENFLGEPMGRDTLNAVGLGATVIARRDPEAVMVVLSADHIIQPVDRFQRALEVGYALAEARADVLVAFGIAPTFAATGYGYLELGEPMDVGGKGEGATGEGATGEGATGEGATGEGATGEGATGEGATGSLLPVPGTEGSPSNRQHPNAQGTGRQAASGTGAAAAAYAVSLYREKPDAPTAQRYLEAGAQRYLWNGGMFAWRAATILDCIRRYEPPTYAGLERIADAWDTPRQAAVLAEVYPTLRKISIDYAVMEPASRDPLVRVAAVPMPLEWMDVGSWPAFAQTCPHDADGNALGAKRYALVDTKNTLVASSDDTHVVTAIGCEGLIIVHTPDATLVCRADRAEDIKKLYAMVEERFGKGVL